MKFPFMREKFSTLAASSIQLAANVSLRKTYDKRNVMQGDFIVVFVSVAVERPMRLSYTGKRGTFAAFLVRSLTCINSKSGIAQ